MSSLPVTCVPRCSFERRFCLRRDRKVHLLFEHLSKVHPGCTQGSSPLTCGFSPPCCIFTYFPKDFRKVKKKGGGAWPLLGGDSRILMVHVQRHPRTLNIRATVNCMILLSEPEYQRLCQLASELMSILARVQPPSDPSTDEVVAQVAASSDLWQASVLYRSLRPLRRGPVAASLRRQGWSRVKKEAGIFWVKPPASPDPSA